MKKLIEILHNILGFSIMLLIVLGVIFLIFFMFGGLKLISTEIRNIIGLSYAILFTFFLITFLITVIIENLYY